MNNFESVRTVEWKDGTVVLIDQTKLPEALELLECREVGEVANAIKRMAVRGAPAIGAAAAMAAMGMALAARSSTHQERNAFLRQMSLAANTLLSTRPTAINLKWAVDRVYSKIAKAEGSVEELKILAVEEAKAIAEEDVAANRRIGSYGAALLADGDRVLTHCKW